MFGLGYQELLLLIIMLALLLFVYPALFYLLVLLGMKTLKSPRRVWIALFILYSVLVFREVGAFGEISVAAFLATVMALLLSGLFVALAFAGLWLTGCLWRWLGLSRLGSAWRDMALFHFRALRPTPKRTT